MDIVLKDESYAIMGACFDVYKEMGCGFLESVYQECLLIELCDRGVPVVEQPKLKLVFKGRTLKQTYEPDFLCYDQIVLAIKAVKCVADEHRAQVINYLKATGKQLGLLVNFGHYPQVEHERYVNQTLSRISRVS